MPVTPVLLAAVVLLVAVVMALAVGLRRSRQQLATERSERATVEQRLLQRDASLAHLVDELPVSLWATDAALRLTATRGRGFAVAGLDPAGLLGGDLREILAASVSVPEEREAALHAHRQALAGVATSYPVRIADRAFDVRVVPLHDGTGRVDGTLGVAIDATDKAEVEAVLAGAVERERELVERLRTVDEMKDSFIQAVSHELRTPLTVLRGFAVTLRRGADVLTEEQRAMLLDRIAVNADRLHALVSDLLDVDRLARGVVSLRRQRTDVADLVLRVLDETDLGDRPLRTDVTSTVAFVDGAKIERIVENLIGNALKHTPSGTPLWVSVHPDEGGVALAVGQSGIAVADELKDDIFEPFRQGPLRQGHSPGTGIGLALVARFAELHGGSAWVEDTPDGGAAFRVYLPDVPPELEGVDVIDVTGAALRRHTGRR
ncbi:MAG: PAS domain-containing protein [Actinobacteria bacterium]|nr:PAS domain-containing protein [Actinomycetota bacterium]